MVHISQTTSTLAFRPVMIFIDGGYLRKEIKKIFGHDKIDFSKLANLLIGLISFGHIRGELIRVFYYDAIVDPKDANYDDQEQYIKNILNHDFYEVRLGRLIKTEGGSYKQKGVDVLLAVDMITKAYLDQYERAILVGGDDDLLDVVKAVKDTGKRVYGVFFRETASKRLIESFDVRRALTSKEADNFIVKT